jgi:hypothetical protein
MNYERLQMKRQGRKRSWKRPLERPVDLEVLRGVHENGRGGVFHGAREKGDPGLCICGYAHCLENKLVKSEIRISNFETNSNLKFPNDKNKDSTRRYTTLRPSAMSLGFGHPYFGHLILFRVSDFVLRILASQHTRNVPDGWLFRTDFLGGAFTSPGPP